MREWKGRVFLLRDPILGDATVPNQSIIVGVDRFSDPFRSIPL